MAVLMAEDKWRYIDPNQNTPGVKKVVAKNLIKAMLKKCKIKMDSLAAVDGIKSFDNDDQGAKHYCCLPL